MQDISNGKNKRIQNLQVRVGITMAVLAVGSFTLYKCFFGTKSFESVYTHSIRYTKDNQIIGHLTYSEADDHLRIVVLEQDGVLFQKLMYVEDYNYRGTTHVRYIDFENNWCMISYYDSSSSESGIARTWTSGENMQIVQEEKFMPYLLETLGLQENYDGTEILDVYDNVPDMRDVKENIKN